ncbi:hypothetical protein [Desulforamulus aquiferis]|uniref:Uncharacterized protein n=1 Tax=Desulforamulus aquiferis TaxID=1397668 RepID=A0AAW7Z8F8_9FIRM|nr:hypothetical protein [Desulforamulus aquiferis]MDO7785808.1 hypothetical protein [Desulforamulus aquiferis]
MRKIVSIIIIVMFILIPFANVSYGQVPIGTTNTIEFAGSISNGAYATIYTFPQNMVLKSITLRHLSASYSGYSYTYRIYSGETLLNTAYLNTSSGDATLYFPPSNNITIRALRGESGSYFYTIITRATYEELVYIPDVNDIQGIKSSADLAASRANDARTESVNAKNAANDAKAYSYYLGTYGGPSESVGDIAGYIRILQILTHLICLSFFL